MVSLGTALWSLGLLGLFCLLALFFAIHLTNKVKALRSNLRSAEIKCKLQIEVIDYQRGENKRLRGLLEAAGVEHETS